jgi:hypothetical protein
MEVLLINNEEGKKHYVLIKDINRMLYSTTKHKGRKYFCMNCLHGCSTEETLKTHRMTCLEVNGTQVRMPNKGTNVKFRNFHKQLPAPFIIYTDFESILEKVGKKETGSSSYTEKYQNHVGCSFGYKVVCHYDKK